MKNRRKTALYLLIGLSSYLLLLGLLVWVERDEVNATITSLPTALWYSLVTLTTVGYGDLYPVTSAGKVIGTLFLLLSSGLLALLIGQVICVAVTRTRSAIHDLLAGTVVVDIASQKVFASTEDLIAYTKRVHAERAQRQEY